MSGPETPKPPVESVVTRETKPTERERRIVGWLEDQVKNRLGASNIRHRNFRESISEVSMRNELSDDAKRALEGIEGGMWGEEASTRISQAERELYVWGFEDNHDVLFRGKGCDPAETVTLALWWLRDVFNMNEYKFALYTRDASGQDRSFDRPCATDIYKGLSYSPFAYDVDSDSKSVRKLAERVALKEGALDPDLAARILMDKLDSIVSGSNFEEDQEGYRKIKLEIECNDHSVTVYGSMKDIAKTVQSINSPLQGVGKAIENLNIKEPFIVEEVQDRPPFNVRLRMNLVPEQK